MSNAEKIRSNVEVHGLEWTKAWARRAGINRDTLSFALYGRYGLI